MIGVIERLGKETTPPPSEGIILASSTPSRKSALLASQLCSAVGESLTSKLDQMRCFISFEAWLSSYLLASSKIVFVHHSTIYSHRIVRKRRSMDAVLRIHNVWRRRTMWECAGRWTTRICSAAKDPWPISQANQNEHVRVFLIYPFLRPHELYTNE